MILILSESSDYATDQVFGYIQMLKVVECVRLNVESIVTDNFICNLHHDFFLIENRKIVYSEITTVWYRRFGTTSIATLLEYVESNISPKLSTQLTNEFKSITQYLFYKLSHCDWINHYSTVNINKFVALDKAIQLDIKIPNTYILNNSKLVESSLDLIVKSAYEPCFFTYKNGFYATYTNEFDKGTNLHFFPSLLQDRIEKAFEIRSFFINGEFYSMAIFSQIHEDTQLDFRRYVEHKPNRFVPFKLPMHYKSKLNKLMEQLGLNCGSLDIIQNKAGEFIFLEVNPVGQFGMIENRCNYGLYKILADTLIHMHEKKEKSIETAE